MRPIKEKNRINNLPDETKPALQTENIDTDTDWLINFKVQQWLNFDWTRVLPLIPPSGLTLSSHKGPRNTALREPELSWVLFSYLFAQISWSSEKLAEILIVIRKIQISVSPLLWSPNSPLQLVVGSLDLWDVVETAESWLAGYLCWLGWLLLCSPHHYTTHHILLLQHTTQHCTVTNIDLPTETGCGLSRNRSVIFWIQA